MTNDQLWFSSLKSQPMRAEDRWPMTNHSLKKWLTSNTICLDRRSPTSTCSTQMYNMVYYGNILPLFVLCTHPNLLLVLPKRRKIMLISRWHSNQMYANVNTTFFIHIFIWWWNIPKSLSLFFVLGTAISFTPTPTISASLNSVIRSVPVEASACKRRFSKCHVNNRIGHCFVLGFVLDLKIFPID